MQNLKSNWNCFELPLKWRTKNKNKKKQKLFFVPRLIQKKKKKFVALPPRNFFLLQFISNHFCFVCRIRWTFHFRRKIILRIQPNWLRSTNVNFFSRLFSLTNKKNFLFPVLIASLMLPRSASLSTQSSARSANIWACMVDLHTKVLWPWSKRPRTLNPNHWRDPSASNALKMKTSKNLFVFEIFLLIFLHKNFTPHSWATANNDFVDQFGLATIPFYYPYGTQMSGRQSVAQIPITGNSLYYTNVFIVEAFEAVSAKGAESALCSSATPVNNIFFLDGQTNVAQTNDLGEPLDYYCCRSLGEEEPVPPQP